MTGSESAVAKTGGLGILVVNYDSAALLAENLAMLDLQALNAHVVVVDNFSSAAAVARIRALGETSGWHVVPSDTNLGFGAGMNLAAERAWELGCDAVLLLNPDLSISTADAAALAAEVRTDPGVAVSPRVRTTAGAVWFGGGRVLVEAGRTTTRPGTDSAADGGWISGACVAVHRNLWKRIGGFDPDYFLYWEDVDFSWRVTAAGGRLKVRSDLSAVHDVGGTQQERGKSPTYVYFNCRNRLLFAARHLDAADQERWARGSARYAREVLLRGGRRALLRRPVRLTSAAVRGTAAGLSLLRAASRRPERVLSR